MKELIKPAVFGAVAGAVLAATGTGVTNRPVLFLVLMSVLSIAWNATASSPRRQ